MIEPLAVGMMAAKMGKVTAHDAVAVLGAGPIGQMALQAAKTHGALDVFVTDVIDYRLDYAEKYGAKAVVNASKEDVVDRIMEHTNNEGVNVVIEASAAIPSVLKSLESEILLLSLLKSSTLLMLSFVLSSRKKSV